MNNLLITTQVMVTGKRHDVTAGGIYEFRD